MMINTLLLVITQKRGNNVGLKRAEELWSLSEGRFCRQCCS